MNRKESTDNKVSNIRTKRGNYIVEAAITLPVFVIVLIVLNSIILMYVCIEDSNFITAKELRKAAAEAVLTDISPAVPYDIAKEIKGNNSVAEDLIITDYMYRQSTPQNDELIGISFRMQMKAPNPMGLASEAEYNGSCITRAYVGKTRQLCPMTDAAMSGEDSEPVFIFPNRGERYHNKGCNTLTAHSTAAILGSAVRSSYRACPKCGSRKLPDGALVYVFPDEGEAFHAGECETLERNYIEVEKRTAVDRGYTPCLKCGG